MSERRTKSSCELPDGSDDRPSRSRAKPTDARAEPEEASRVLRFDDFRWEGVAPGAYKEDGPGWRGVSRHALIGETGDATAFDLRYFEVQPGGYTTYERHEHRHVVVAIRGRGEVRLGERWEPIAFGDVVYIASRDPHQFRCAGDEPFGFLCVVSARRDPPEALPDDPA